MDEGIEGHLRGKFRPQIGYKSDPAKRREFEDGRGYPDADPGAIFAEEFFLERTGGAKAQTLFVSKLIGGRVSFGVRAAQSM